ncbi:DNA repair protein RecO [Roseisolibacter sp. H3M3-2]|uniref:DNA repair protein RecO n=1 Tax=Roseisolibacter sp. H3M3-2 TaxID=3031323 RepID=UPI0023DC1483|nr:DNA repair protein RecO [Roseisolibacter sp. H3M3-2]MDF1502260.1 DNA repair protein RecO [Roseisolibacter sp. H3M3-2]
MALVVTDAIVLHSFDYLESSRVLRLATREHGVQSVLAKGARRSQKRFSGALDLFAEGQAQFYARAGRDLHTLASFDVNRARFALAADLERFAAAAALAELVLRFARDESEPTWYDTLVDALDAVAVADPGAARAAGLAGAWRLVAALGFAPSLDACASCHDALPAERPARFSHPAGGLLCERCGRLAGVGRALLAEARAALRAWVGAEDEEPPLDPQSARAHQRLLREFLREHLTDGRPLRAFESWEGSRLAAGPASPGADAAP